MQRHNPYIYIHIYIHISSSSSSLSCSFPMAITCKSSLFLFCALLSVVSLPRPVFSGDAVPSLPGFPGPLPFTLETGYITVGDVEFFYYFVQSDSNPRADPLLLYINGGPGCSGFNGFIYQIGPLKFNITDYVGGLPTLIYEPNTWSKTANLLFLDAPVGAGFSYATTDEGYYTTDTMNANQIHHFLRNWLSEHPKFITNRVYLGSDSYAGLIIPMLATDIISGNALGLEPQIRLEGYSLGCPHTFTDLETNSRIDYAHRLTLISDGLYESAKNSCGGNYVTSTSANCTVDLAAITECIELINRQNILEPNCAFTQPESNLAFQLSPNQDRHRRALQQLTGEYIRSNSDKPDLWCKNIDYLLSDFWLNDADVQAALHIRNGTKGEVYRCNATLSGYTVDIDNVVAYHQNLTAIGMQILVFSGDHDMMIPHIAIETWIKYLGLDIESDWRPWFVDGQVAGYTRKYSETGYRLTYATLKGSGHSPPEYKRKECYHMFDRWVHFYPL